MKRVIAGKCLMQTSLAFCIESSNGVILSDCIYSFVAKLWPERTDAVRYVGPTICNETGNRQKSSLAATSLIVID